MNWNKKELNLIQRTGTHNHHTDRRLIINVGVILKSPKRRTTTVTASHPQILSRDPLKGY